jgi:hypothetical protein
MLSRIERTEFAWSPNQLRRQLFVNHQDNFAQSRNEPTILLTEHKFAKGSVWKILLAALLLLFVAIGRLSASNDELSFIKLIDGYSLREESSVDSVAWTIQKKDGPSIHFEAGFSQGLWADPKQSKSYSWYRVQTVNGYEVRFALVKPGLRTRWEPEDSRGLAPGNILLVTFLLDGEQSFHTANFSAKVANSHELADVLLMVLTFNPSKGKF